MYVDFFLFVVDFVRFEVFDKFGVEMSNKILYEKFVF